MTKRVAITGITGLLGARLANIMAEKGFVVYGLIRDEPSNIYLNSKINKIYGNTNSIEDISYFLKKASPDYIFHLAAQTQAYESLTHPYDTFYTNFVGSLNILEAARLYVNPTAIVIASTDKAYGELDDDEYLESSPLNGKFPYDASKVTTDILAKSYRHTYNMPIAVTRGCNIYGPGDNNTQRLIPGIAKAFLTNQEFVIRNGGRDIREYIHVDDVSEAYIKIAEHVEEKNLHAAFNISSGNRYSTIEVFNLMEKAIGKEINSKIIFEDAKEISKQLMNHDLLTSATGWEPKIKFEDGIKDVASWYLNNTI
jgi:CDP-glucose 4,6-dehydratase